MKLVVDASPLIVLFKSELAHLLPQLSVETLVPVAVWDEVLAGGESDPAAQALPAVGWARRVEVTSSHPIITTWNLGAGESEVLNLAHSLSGYRAMVDDAAARACARTLGISMIGTGGLLVIAKRRGLISSVETALQTVRDAGLWLSDDVARLLTQQAGE